MGLGLGLGLETILLSVGVPGLGLGLGLGLETILVSVPVLSEQSTVMPASCSIDESRATIARFDASSREPSAIVAVHTTCIG